MLLIKTRVGPSVIHGNGVFACEVVRPGQTVWRFHAEFDRVISEEELVTLPEAFQHYVDMYAYRSADLGGKLVLSCDHAKFLNHSVAPNTEEHPFMSVACAGINIGEEMTCNYGSFCVGWRGFDSD